MDKSMYDNSKEALAAIMREHGADVLLGSRLKSFFNDYAPGMKKSRKNVIFLVPESGAAEILQRSIGAGAEEQEIAFKQAVQKVIGEYPIERGEVESVMLEFTAALGWKVNIQENPGPTPGSSLTPGQRNYQFGKYLWRVLDVKNGRALLLAEEILEKRRYHRKRKTSWEKCELRSYLNEEFLRTFSSLEQSRIAQTVNTNADNPWFGTRGGSSTTDRLFLLSIEEVVKYFGDSRDLRVRKGWYYEKRDCVLKDGKGYCINDQYNSTRIANYGNVPGWWWLRSPGDKYNHAMYVDCGGRIDLSGTYDFLGQVETDSKEGGVRPALWLNL